MVIEELRQAGLPPGPRAYDSLIYANAKAGRPQEALEGLRAAYAEGQLPRAWLLPACGPGDGSRLVECRRHLRQGGVRA